MKKIASFSSRPRPDFRIRYNPRCDRFQLHFRNRRGSWALAWEHWDAEGFERLGVKQVRRNRPQDAAEVDRQWAEAHRLATYHRSYQQLTLGDPEK